MNKNKTPNLIIPGFPKSGTSSLYDYLGQHPDIFASYRKEPHIYTFQKRYNERFEDKNLTHSFDKFYNKYDDEKYIMDGSTTYLISNDALIRIRKDIKNPKIIIIARDPIERVFSHFNWLRMMGYEQRKFKKEIEVENQKKFNPEINLKGNFKNYLEFSLYGEQIRRCYEIFDNQNVFILPMERLKHRFDKSFEEIFKFLQVEPIPLKNSLKNKTPERVVLKKHIPTKIKIIEKRISYHLISNSRLFSKVLKPKRFKISDEKFLFELLKDDLYLLKELNLVFPEWKTVNKWLK
jgi:hypothetical protein